MPGLLDRVSSKSTVSKEHKCTVQLLDDTQTMTVDFKKHDVGQVVLDYVCNMLNIVEKDYFGLRYVDNNRHRYWLDTTKPILRQVKSSSIVFAFRVKFYPSDPTIVKEELTRYMIAQQLRRDLLHGRLYCPQTDAATLGAYILQGDVGDYDPEEQAGNYVSQFKLFLNQAPKLEEKIAVEHQKLKGKGLTPADADKQFLKKACLLDTYGYYPYTIKDPKHGQVYMGATPHGVLVYQTHRKLHHIKWDDISNFDYVGKDFFVYAKPEYFIENNIEETNGEEPFGDGAEDHDSSDAQNRVNDHNTTDASKTAKKKSALRFTCPSATFCKHLWKYMLAQQAFFTKQRSNEVKPVAIRRGLLFRRATFRYSGRVLQEIKEAPSPRRAEPSFERSHLQRQMPRDERSAPWANKFHTLPRAMKPDLTESKAPLVSSEAPEEIVGRDSLLLDTTAQASPDVTPLSGLSPASTGDTAVLNGGTNDQLTGAPSTPATAYKQDTVTVSLKRVGLTESTTESPPFKTDIQQPLSSSTWATPANEQPVKRGIIRQKNGSPPAADTEILKYEDGVSSSMLETEPMGVVGPKRRKKGGAGRVLVTTILGGLMFTILMIGTIVVIMEIQDPQVRDYLRQVPGEDAFRHGYYEPTRQRALDYYDQAMGGRRE